MKHPAVVAGGTRRRRDAPKPVSYTHLYEEGALPRFSYKRLRENVMLMQIDLEDNV